MPRLFVPPQVHERLVAERQQHNAELTRACYSDRVCEQWTRELKRLDPLLKMVRAPEHVVIGTPLEPGYYHVVRCNENAPWSVFPVRGPEGEFVYPPSGLLDRLKAMDMWNASVPRLREQMQRKAQEELERRKVTERRDRQEQIVDHYRKVTSASISMNRDSAWHQNVAGRRGRGPRSRPR